MKHRESLHAFRHTFLQSLDPKARRALELFAEAMHEVDVLTGQGGYAEQFEAGRRDLVALAEWYEDLKDEPAFSELAAPDLRRARDAAEIAMVLRRLAG